MQSSFREGENRKGKAKGEIIFLANIYQSKQETLNAKLNHNHIVNFKWRKSHRKSGPSEDKKEKSLPKIKKNAYQRAK
jgi:ribosomal protein L25 (general stress protein Ctc)